MRVEPPAQNCSALFDTTNEKCTCLPVRGPNNTSQYNCDCNYKNIQVIRNINIPEAQCSCLTTNTLARPCSCCVPGRFYRDSVAPSTCESGNPVATCASTMTSVFNATSKRNVTTLRGDCIATVNNVTITNLNMTLDQSKCACFNDIQGKLVCRCCMSGNLNIRKPIDRQCRVADQLPSTCDCVGNSSSCSCTVFNGPYAFSFSNLTTNQSSDCNCVRSAQGNRATSQCSCCQPRSLLNITAPVCDASSATI